MGQPEGKTAVVTGGGTGIGLATAAHLASEGAHVFITGRCKDVLDRAVESTGSAVTAVPGDIAEPANLDRLYDAISDRGRGLDVLFANAADSVRADDGRELWACTRRRRPRSGPSRGPWPTS